MYYQKYILILIFFLSHVPVIFAANTLTLSAISGALTIKSATAGFLPKDATATATYSLGTTSPTCSIVGQIDTNLPSSLQLFVTLAAPPRATGVGAVALSTAAATLVSGITPLQANALGIFYRFHQLTDVVAMAPFTRTVTFTLMAN